MPGSEGDGSPVAPQKLKTSVPASEGTSGKTKPRRSHRLAGKPPSNEQQPSDAQEQAANDVIEDPELKAPPAERKGKLAGTNAHSFEQNAATTADRSCQAWEESLERTGGTILNLEQEKQRVQASHNDWEANFERHRDEALTRVAVSGPSGESVSRAHANVKSDGPMADTEALMQPVTVRNTKEQDQETGAKAESFLNTLIANVEAGRALHVLSAKAQSCKRDIEILRSGKGGVDDILAKVNQLPDKRQPEDMRQLKQAQNELAELQDAIGLKEQEGKGARTLLNHASSEQERRDARLYDLMEGMIIPASSPLLQCPVDFWMQLATCKELVEKARSFAKEHRELIEERTAAEDEVDDITIRDIRAHAGLDHNGDVQVADFSRQPQYKLRTSKRFLELSRRREELDAQIERVEAERVRAEVVLNRRAEEFLVSRNLLPATKTVKKGQGAEDDLATRKASHYPTPFFTSPQSRHLAGANEAKIATELTRRLRTECRSKLDAARADLDRCETRLHNMHNEEASRVDGDRMHSDEEHARRHFLEKSKRSRELIEAEAAFASALRRAQDAGVVLADVEAKSRGFSSHASDGYLQTDIRAHISRTDFRAIGVWMEQAEEAGAPGSGDPLPANPGKEGEEISDGPADADVLQLRSLALGESFSVVACDKRKVQIDSVIDRWRQGNDGFPRQRRGSI